MPHGPAAMARLPPLAGTHVVAASRRPACALAPPQRKWAIPWGSEGESESNEPSPLGIAEGQGLTRIVTGILHSFTVRVTNAHQIHRHPITRDDVGIYVRSGPGTPTFYLNQLGEDLYRVDWLASMSGNYTLQVSVRGFPVKDSPFVVAAEAAYTWCGPNPKP